jgi:hypothetical protein
MGIASFKNNGAIYSAIPNCLNHQFDEIIGVSIMQIYRFAKISALSKPRINGLLKLAIQM